MWLYHRFKEYVDKIRRENLRAVGIAPKWKPLMESLALKVCSGAYPNPPPKSAAEFGRPRRFVPPICWVSEFRRHALPILWVSVILPICSPICWDFFADLGWGVALSGVQLKRGPPFAFPRPRESAVPAKRAVVVADRPNPLHLRCRRFTFFDQVHTTGMDIPQPFVTSALLTLGTHMTFRDYAQGAYRMRGIGKGQTIRLLVVPQVGPHGLCPPPPCAS